MDVTPKLDALNQEIFQKLMARPKVLAAFVRAAATMNSSIRSLLYEYSTTGFNGEHSGKLNSPTIRQLISGLETGDVKPEELRVSGYCIELLFALAKESRSVDRELSRLEANHCGLRNYMLEQLNSSIAYITTKFAYNLPEKKDLMTAAYLGAIDGINRFDFRLGYSIHTYVSPWVWKALRAERAGDAYLIGTYGEKTSPNVEMKEDMQMLVGVQDEGKLEAVITDHTPENALLNGETWDLFAREIASLPAKYRKPLQLYYGLGAVKQMTPTAAARKLGISKKQFDSDLLVAVNWLRACVEATDLDVPDMTHTELTG